MRFSYDPWSSESDLSQAYWLRQLTVGKSDLRGLWCFVVDSGGFIGIVLGLYWHLPGFSESLFVGKTWIDCGELCG
jgi:hypothetical protein